MNPSIGRARPAGGRLLAAVGWVLAALALAACAVEQESASQAGGGATPNDAPARAGEGGQGFAERGDAGAAGGGGLRVALTASAQRVCAGDCTTLRAEVAGGSPPYVQTWSPALDADDAANQVCPTQSMTYAVTVRDALAGDMEFASEPVTASIEIGVEDACPDGALPEADGAAPGEPPTGGVEPRELEQSCRVQASLGPDEGMLSDEVSLVGTPHVAPLAVDGAGNFTVAISFAGLLDVGGEVLDTKGSLYALAVAKYDASCQWQWSRSYGGTPLSWVGGASVAATGTELVLAGTFSGAIDFGAGLLVSPANGSAILLRLDASGQTSWSRPFVGSTSARFYDVAVDAAGDIVVTGQFVGEGSLGGDTLGVAADNASVPFVAKFSPEGAHRWSRIVPGQPFSDLMLGLLQDGSIVVAALSDLSEDVVAFDPDGELLFTVEQPLPDEVSFEAQLGFDARGDRIAVAYEQVSSGRALALRRFDAAGLLVSDTAFTRGNEVGQVGGLALDAAGNVFEVGAFEQTLDGTSLTSAGGVDAFLLQHDAQGVTVGYAQVGTPAEDEPLAVVVDDTGHAVLAVVTEHDSLHADLTLIRYLPWGR